MIDLMKRLIITILLELRIHVFTLKTFLNEMLIQWWVNSSTYAPQINYFGCYQLVNKILQVGIKECELSCKNSNRREMYCSSLVSLLDNHEEHKNEYNLLNVAKYV